MLSTLTLLTLVSTPALAQEAEKKFPVLKPGAQIFGHWGMDLSEGADGANAFAISRVYTWTRAEVSDSLAVRVTLDADTLKATTVAVPGADGTTTTYTAAGDTKVRVFVKHAYLEWKAPAGTGLKVRAGMAETPWAPYHDQFMGTRWLSREAADSVRWHSTADLGVQVMGSHAKGLVDWQVGLVNGEGFDAPEVDASKTGQVRVTVDPLGPKGKLALPISGYFSQSVGGEADAIQMFGGAAGFRMPYLGFWGEYVMRTQGDVSGSMISVAALPRVPKVAGLIARVDLHDPSLDTDGDEVLKLVGGVTRDVMDRISVGATFERSSTEAATTQGVFVKMQAGF